MGRWKEEAMQDAKNIVGEEAEDICERLVRYAGQINRRKGSLDENLDRGVNELYGHEPGSLAAAAEMLDDLSDFEETDSGLFMVKGDIRKSLEACACFTYQNAVRHHIGKVLDAIEEDAALAELCGAEEPDVDEVRKRLDEVLDEL